MPGAPTGGTVTFLFTDVESCTARWESSVEAVEVAVARYEVILTRCKAQPESRRELLIATTVENK